MNTKTHTDIKPEHWILRVLPKSLKPYGILARIDRPIGIWLLLFPGWWSILLASGKGVTDPHVISLFALFAIGAVVMRAAGCVINDLWDRDLDAQVERTRLRPIASGEVPLKNACIFLICLLLCGLGVLVQMNVLTIILGCLSLPLIALYPLMKRITWWPQAFLGLTFNFGALMGWTAVMNALSWQAVVLYIGCIFWTLGYDTIYTHQDKEDDALIGIKSTALYFGPYSKHWVSGFYMLSFLCLCVMAGVECIWLLLAAAHLLWQIVRWNMDSPQSALKIFKSNIHYGLLLTAGLVFVALL